MIRRQKRIQQIGAIFIAIMGVFDKIKANPSWQDIPVIFLTARSDDLAANAGSMIADDYIEKPIDIEKLKTRIENVLKKKMKK